LQYAQFSKRALASLFVQMLPQPLSLEIAEERISSKGSGQIRAISYAWLRDIEAKAFQSAIRGKAEYHESS
jgi:hypothetical protein